MVSKQVCEIYKYIKECIRIVGKHNKHENVQS
jgi:hypothetical protein